MGGRLARGRGDGFVHSYCNTVPTPQGGTHEAGPAQRRCCAALQGLWRAGGNRKRAGQITAEDVIGGAVDAAVALHPRPAVPGPDQGAAGHARRRRAWSRPRSRTISTIGCRPIRRRPQACSTCVIERAEERLRRTQDKEHGAQDRRPRKLRLPGKLADCSRDAPRRHRDLPGRGRLAPAARPSRRATARPRRCCRCAARS